MSVDTTVVVFGRENAHTGDREYTAVVVQAAENLEAEDGTALRIARLYTEKDGLPWFRRLSRAKQFAHLIAEEERRTGSLEYEGMPLYFFDETGVYPMSRKGKIHARARKRWDERYRQESHVPFVRGYHPRAEEAFLGARRG